MVRSNLWDEERANTRTALLFLADRPTPAQLAEALGMTMNALSKAHAPSQRSSMRLAAQVTRAAQVNLENVLTGAWPGDMCPTSGRSGGSTPGEGRRRHRGRASRAQEGV